MAKEIKESKIGDKESQTVYLTEYESLWTETMARFNFQNQVLSLQVAVIAASVSAVEVFKSEPIFYLFGSIVLGFLSWIFIEQTVRNQTIGYYIHKVLSPKIKKVSSNPDLIPLEYFDWGYQTHWRNVFVGVISMAKFLLGILLALIFCILFWSAKSITNQIWSAQEKVLFTVSIFVLFLPALISLISVATMLRKPKKAK